MILHIRGHSIEHICHHFWVGATANPPKSDDSYAQLTRGAFIMNDFLQNPHFRDDILAHCMLPLHKTNYA